MLRDITYAFRVLRKDAGAAGAAAAVLALGIGSATLVFSLANGLLLRPLPYPRADRLVALEEYSPTDPNPSRTVNFLNYLDFRSRTRLLSDLALYDAGESTLVERGSASHITVTLTTDGLFAVLGVAPVLGRTFTWDDCLPTASRTAVISDDFWRDHYGRDPSVIGKFLETANARFRILGVMPPGFHFPDRSDAWFAWRPDPATVRRTDYERSAVARLKDGVSVQAATADLESMLRQIHGENPAVNNGWHIRAIPLRDAFTHDYHQAVVTLLIAVGFLLLIACANVGHLLLVRASARSRELAVRVAIGASYGRLLRQLAAESLVLSSVGGVVGALLAFVGTPALLSLIPIDLPLWMNFSLDRRVLLFALTLSLLTALVSGVAPLAGLFGADLMQPLKAGARGGSSSLRQKFLRRSLVVAEVALSVALLIGAGLMIRSFRALHTQALGYAPQHVLSFIVDYPDRSYPGAKGRALLDHLTRSIVALPGVVSAAAATQPPLETSWTRYFTVEGRPVPLKDMPFVTHTIVTPGYFRTLELPLLQGRDFIDADYDGPPVVIVSQGFARRHWPGESAIGKRLRFGPPKNNEPWYTVVGVAADSKQRNLQQDDDAGVYLAYRGNVAPSAFAVRTSGDPRLLTPAIRATIHAIDPAIVVSHVLSLEQIRDRVSWRERFFAILVTGFTAIALLLATVGLYAMLSYVVSLQRHEIGIRIAVGAAPADIWLLVVRQGFGLTVAGLLAGAVSALGLTRFLRSQLFHVSPLDPLSWVAAIGFLLAVALLAALVPARRAMRVDPVIALRQE
jgi:putative ABC transport system permease protein